MHLSSKCASKFAPEGQLRLQLAPFLRTSRRDWVLVRASRPRSTRQFSGLFLPQQGIVSMFFSGAGRQPISASPVLFLANEGWITWLQCIRLYKEHQEPGAASPLLSPYLARSNKDSIVLRLRLTCIRVWCSVPIMPISDIRTSCFIFAFTSTSFGIYMKSIIFSSKKS